MRLRPSLKGATREDLSRRDQLGLLPGQGSIYRRPAYVDKNGHRKPAYWIVQIRHQGKSRRWYCKTEAQAVKKLGELQDARLTTSNGGMSARQPMEEYLADWLSTIKGTVKPKTFRSYAGHVARLERLLRGVPLRLLDHARIQRMLDEARTDGQRNGGKLSAATLRGLHLVLHNALQYATDNGLIPRNPAAGRFSFPHATKQPFPWQRPERERFLTAIKGHAWEPLFLVAYYQGLRLGEVLGLQWRYVDLERGRLMVRYQFTEDHDSQPILGSLKTTDASYRTLPLYPDALDALRHFRATWKPGVGEWGDCLFLSPRTARPYHPRTVDDQFQAVLSTHDLPHIDFHGLRHVACTILALRHVPVKAAQGFMGHASISTTMNVYAEIGDEDMEEAITKAWAAA